MFLKELRRPTRIPSILYHLTDAQGALGIISSKTLWSSLASALNDASEVSYGTQVATDVATERFQARPTEFSKALVGYLTGEYLAPAGNNWTQYPFVVSFCESCDKSGQWLHYGRSGKGIALGFHSDIAPTLSAELVAVDYEPASQREKFTRLFARAEQVATNAGPNIAAHITTMYATFMTAWMKHPSFSDEREWRLWGTVTFQEGKLRSSEPDLDKVTTRFSDGRLVPYEAIPFGSRLDVLQEVVVGYSSPVSLDAMRLVLLRHGCASTLRRSEVPVR